MQVLKEEIRNGIYRAALEEFRDKGFEKASMRSIARSAGITVGNMYRYFSSKEDLFYAVISPAYNRVVTAIMDNSKADETALAYYSGGMEQLADLILGIFVNHRTELLILLDGSKGSKYESAKQDVINLVEDRLRIMMYRSSGKEDIGTDNQFFIRLICTSLVEGFIVILKECKDNFKTKNMIKRYMEFFFKDITRRT